MAYIPTNPAEAATYAQRAIDLSQHRDERMDDDAAAWELRTDDPASDDERMRLNDCQVQVDAPAAMMAAVDMTVQVAVPADDPPVARELGQQIEDVCRWFLDEVDERLVVGLQMPLRYQLAWFLCLRGWAAVRCLLDPRDRAFPWNVQLLDPRDVYPNTYEGAVHCYVHAYCSTLGALKQEWGDKLVKRVIDSRDDQEEIVCYGFYTPTELGLLANGQWLKKPVAHQYGHNPLIVTLATGAGYRGPVRNLTGDRANRVLPNGRTRQDWDRYIGTGILESIRPIVEDTQALATMQRIIAAKSAEPPTIAFTVGGEEPNEIPTDPGATATMRVGEAYGQYPPPAQALQYTLALRSLQRQQIEQAGVGGALLTPPPGASGYANYQMMSTAARAMKPRMAAKRLTLRLLLRHMLQLFARYGGPPIAYTALNRDTGVRTAANRLDPMLLANVPFVVDVRFGELGPMDKVAMGNLAGSLLERGVIDTEYALGDLLNVDNPSAVRQRAKQEQIDKHPVLMLLDGLSAAALTPDPLRPWRQPIAQQLLQQELLKFELAGQAVQAQAAGLAGPQAPPGLGPPPAAGGPPPEMLPNELGGAAGLPPNAADLGGVVSPPMG